MTAQPTNPTVSSGTLPGRSILVEKSTVYELNEQGFNRWSAQVQPGYDGKCKIAEEECVQVAQRIAAALASSPAIPAGWKLVLIEPNKEMIDAGCRHTMRADEQEPYRARGEAIASYMDMLAVCPAAPSASAAPAEPDAQSLQVDHEKELLRLHDEAVEAWRYPHYDEGRNARRAEERFRAALASFPFTPSAKADASLVTRAEEVEPAPDSALSQAAIDVLAERRRQVEVEGWTPEHDDQDERQAPGFSPGSSEASGGVKYFL